MSAITIVSIKQLVVMVQSIYLVLTQATKCQPEDNLNSPQGVGHKKGRKTSHPIDHSAGHV